MLKSHWPHHQWSTFNISQLRAQEQLWKKIHETTLEYSWGNPGLSSFSSRMLFLNMGEIKAETNMVLLSTKKFKLTFDKKQKSHCNQICRSLTGLAVQVVYGVWGISLWWDLHICYKTDYLLHICPILCCGARELFTTRQRLVNKRAYFVVTLFELFKQPHCLMPSIDPLEQDWCTRPNEKCLPLMCWQ